MVGRHGITTGIVKVTANFRPALRATQEGALALGLAFLSLACSSPTKDGSEPGAGAASTSGGTQSVSGGNTSAGQSNPSTAAGTGSGGSGSGGPAAGGMPGASGSTGSGGGGTQCRDGVLEADWEANCLACAANDTCAACLCKNCSAELQACDATEGCAEIAVCVQSSGCQGVDCYCGTDTPVACAGGGGNGPCKDAFLSAPGGKAPTLAELSAGPASDAVAGVAACMQNQATCGAVCN